MEKSSLISGLIILVLLIGEIILSLSNIPSTPKIIYSIIAIIIIILLFFIPKKTHKKH